MVLLGFFRSSGGNIIFNIIIFTSVPTKLINLSEDQSEMKTRKKMDYSGSIFMNFSFKSALAKSHEGYVTKNLKTANLRCDFKYTKFP